jgi:hypothetical protein
MTSYHRSPRNAAPMLARIGILVLFFAHFALTVCYVMPINPIRIKLNRVLGNTIGRFFRQNWSLFAPSPVQSNQRMLVRPLTAQEAAAATLPADGWYDVTTPVIARHQQNRFSAYDRLNRTQATALRDYFGGGIMLHPWMEACAHGDKKACQHYQDGLNAQRRFDSDLLRRTASAFCKDIQMPCAKVAVRIRESPAAPWSARHDNRPMPSQDFDVAVFDFDPEVVPAGIYATRGKVQ